MITSEPARRSERPASAARGRRRRGGGRALRAPMEGASSHTSPSSSSMPALLIATWVSPRRKSADPSERRTSARAPLPVASAAPVGMGAPEITVGAAAGLPGSALACLSVTSPEASSRRAPMVVVRTGAGLRLSTTAVMLVASTNTPNATRNVKGFCRKASRTPENAISRLLDRRAGRGPALRTRVRSANPADLRRSSRSYRNQLREGRIWRRLPRRRALLPAVDQRAVSAPRVELKSAVRQRLVAWTSRSTSAGIGNHRSCSMAGSNACSSSAGCLLGAAD